MSLFTLICANMVTQVGEMIMVFLAKEKENGKKKNLVPFLYLCEY